ncbi:hypothetical protein Tco_0203059, partial [Tanacetum coccineum]
DVEDEEEYGDEEMLYGDLNLNREMIDAGMTEAHATKDMEDTNTPSSDTTTLQPSTLNIHSLQLLVTSTPTTFPTINLPEISNFASLFGFEQRVSLLEIKLSELKQTNQFVEAVSSILGIIANYLTSKMKEAVDVAVQLKSNKLREEAKAENQDFINSLDSNMNKIIKD